jgi:hypothetical protein
MTVRILRIIGFVLISLGCASQVSADWFFGIFNGAARETKRRQCWPEPFDTADRQAARMPFAAMVNNGWERQNLLSEFHFAAGSGQLNEAGRTKVRWIFLSAPKQHRVAYVHIAVTQAETDARMAAVQQLVAQIAPNDVGAIFVTAISEEGWPAQQVDKIDRKFIESTPIPRLPEESSTSSSGGGSGGGSGM